MGEVKRKGSHMCCLAVLSPMYGLHSMCCMCAVCVVCANIKRPSSCFFLFVPQVQLQTMLMMTVLFIAIMLHIAYEPYEYDSHDDLELWSLVAGMITLFVGMLFTMDILKCSPTQVPIETRERRGERERERKRKRERERKK